MPGAEKEDCVYRSSFAVNWRGSTLSRRLEFTEVLASRCKLRGKYLIMRYAENKLDRPRLGLVVPKRIVASAVRRNQIKRRLRDQFRKKLDQLGGFDCIALLHSPCEDLPTTKAVAADFTNLLDKLVNQDSKTKTK